VFCCWLHGAGGQHTPNQLRLVSLILPQLLMFGVG
jgi:hypothetical protein